MTESEWNDCVEPGSMLKFLQGLASDRQFRLFACACCRGINRFIPVGPCREAVEVSLRYADGQATADELAMAQTAAVALATHAGPHTAAAWAACEAANPSAFGAARAAAHETQEQIRKSSPRAAADEARAQAAFLRDIVGDPFATSPRGVIWRLTGDTLVREIAEAVYTNPAREDMRHLAVELVRLGCPDDALLEHCRSDEPHVRGCWAIDRLLGKDSGLSQPVGSPGRVRPARTEEIRTAFANYLSPKKYRRCLRKAIAAAPGPGRLGRTEEWDRFVSAHPEYNLSDDELTTVFAICPVHGTELVERVVRTQAEDWSLISQSKFLEARATQFPCSYPEASAGWVTERLGWWCAECQRARAEWMARA